MSSSTEGISIDRYVLLEDLTGADAGPGVRLWRGRDLVLEREVSIRLLDIVDPRAAQLASAARRVALVEDRRLLRILDVMEVPEFAAVPRSIGIVSEWARGRTLAQALIDREGEPFTVSDAVIIVADVARAVSAGLASGVTHGRLRPSSVVITDAGEVRVRGMAVDEAIWGPLQAAVEPERADVDGLGSLLYFCLTGTWPGLDRVDVPLAPRVGSVVLPPSRVRADVPRSMDEVVARSVLDSARPRGTSWIANAQAFYSALGIARDYEVPVAQGPRRAEMSIPSGWPRRLMAIGIGGALVIAGWMIGWRMVDAGPQPWQPDPKAESRAILTDVGSSPSPASSGEGEQVRVPVGITSFDPLADDNGNGSPDRKKGRENEESVGLLLDSDPTNGWSTDRYSSADAGGKGGVGLVLDLGTSKPIRSASLDFGEAGAGVEVRVSDTIEADPQRWRLLASSPPGAPQINLRSPRPISGRYVLVWLTSLPPASDGSSRFQGTVRQVTLAG